MDPLAIRQILNKVSVLTESTGLAGRKPGATFVNPDNNDTIIFNEIKFFPQEGGKYSPEDLTAAIEQVESELGLPIQWENIRNPKSGGFSLATFSKGDETMAVGRYFQEIKPVATDNYVPNLVLGTYKFAGKAAAKTQAGLTPQDLLTDRTDLTIKDIMVQLSEKLGTDNPLYHVAHHVAMGQPLPLEIKAPEGMSFSAFRDYFGEILQPMALQRGLYTGNAGEAAERFLGKNGFAGTLINFDSAKNAGLSDSILTTKDGRYVKISSKGDKGAEASSKNLIDSIDELKDSPAGDKLLKKYSDTIEMIREIQRQGQSGAPLYLGVEFDVIDESDADIIRGLKSAAPVDIRSKEALKAAGLSDNLIKLAQERGTKTPEKTSLFYHLLASVAHKAADEVNSKTDFSDTASDILNNGALVQVYTKADEKKGMWILKEFETKYPGTSVGGVVLSASKNYSSTGIKGNFTFKILRGNAKAIPDDNTEETPMMNDTDDTAGLRAPGERAEIEVVKKKERDGAGRERRR